MPHLGRAPVVVSRVAPTGPRIWFPICTDWTCGDAEDWVFVLAEDEDYSAIRRESDIVQFHQPRIDRFEYLDTVRKELSDGDPLWWGRPAGVETPKKLQCKDIKDERFLSVVAYLQTLHGHPALVDHIAAHSIIPRNLVVAKARKLIRKKKLSGCACGCRGDFRVL